MDVSCTVSKFHIDQSCVSIDIILLASCYCSQVVVVPSFLVLCVWFVHYSGAEFVELFDLGLLGGQ